jgi:hypothetical protein
VTIATATVQKKPPPTPQQQALKQALKDLAAQESESSQYWAVGLGTCAFLASFFPPAAPLAYACTAGGLAMGADATRLTRIARKDPPDSHWRSIVKPQLPRIPPLKPGNGVTADQASALNGVVAAHAAAIGYMDAFMTSVNRESSAAAAHSGDWVRRQQAAERSFAGSAASAFGRVASLSQQAAPRLASLSVAVPLSALQTAQRQLAASGNLPSLFGQIGRSFGLSPADLESLKSSIVSTNLSTFAAAHPEILSNPIELLVGPNQVALARSEQVAFNNYARGVVPAPTAGPNLTGTWQPSGPSSPAWKLTTGSNGASLTASWRGGGTHSGLVGSFSGTLSADKRHYVGTMHVTEGSTDVTGTMTFTVVSTNSLTVTYKQSNGVTGSVTLTRIP